MQLNLTFRWRNVDRIKSSEWPNLLNSRSNAIPGHSQPEVQAFKSILKREESGTKTISESTKPQVTKVEPPKSKIDSVTETQKPITWSELLRSGGKGQGSSTRAVSIPSKANQSSSKPAVLQQSQVWSQMQLFSLSWWQNVSPVCKAGYEIRPVFAKQRFWVCRTLELFFLEILEKSRISLSPMVIEAIAWVWSPDFCIFIQHPMISIE